MCKYCEYNGMPPRWRGPDAQSGGSDNRHDQVEWGIYKITRAGDHCLTISGWHECFGEDYDTWFESTVLSIPINNCPNCGRKL